MRAAPGRGAARAARRRRRRLYRLLHAAYRALRPTSAAGRPVDPAALRRVLVLPRPAIGDLVAVTPALDFLRAAAPQARLDVVASGRSASLLAGDARVDRVITHDVSGWRGLRLVPALRRARYDAIVTAGHGQHAQLGWLTALAARRHTARITYFRPAQYWGLFTHVARTPGFERRHVAERVLHAVRRAVSAGAARADGLTADCLTARYPLSLPPNAGADARVAHALAALLPGPGRPLVAVNCWATTAVRTLDVAQAARLLALMAAAAPEAAFVLTPPPGAAGDAEAIARAAADQAPALAAGRLAVFPPPAQLVDLAALLRRARVVLTPDTANVHLASAVGRPVVALYHSAAADPTRLWGPLGVPHRVEALDPPGPLREMPPERAARAFASLWDEVAAAGA